MLGTRVLFTLAAISLATTLVAGCAARQPEPFRLIDATPPTGAVEPANYPDTSRLEIEPVEPKPFPALERAVTITDDDEVEVLLARGRLLLRHYRPLQARAVFDESLRRFPGTAASFAGRALSYLAVSDLENATRSLSQAMDRAADDPFVLMAAARTAAAQRQFEQAYRFATQAISANDRDAEAYWTRYEVLRLAGDAERALDDLERALQLDASFPPALVSYAGIAMRAGRTDEAVSVLDRLSSRDPEQAIYYVYRSEAHDLAGRRDEAIADATKAVELSPSNAAFLRHRGFLNEQAGDVDAAEQDYRRSIRLDPDSPFGYLRLAVLAANNGDFTLAVPLAEDGLRRVRPSDARDDALLMHATVLAGYGEAQQAFAELTEAVGINQARPSLRLRRAELAITLHQFDVARDDLIWVRDRSGSERDRQLAVALLSAIRDRVTDVPTIPTGDISQSNAPRVAGR